MKAWCRTSNGTSAGYFAALETRHRLSRSLRILGTWRAPSQDQRSVLDRRNLRGSSSNPHESRVQRLGRRALRSQRFDRSSTVKTIGHGCGSIGRRASRSRIPFGSFLLRDYLTFGPPRGVQKAVGCFSGGFRRQRNSNAIWTINEYFALFGRNVAGRCVWLAFHMTEARQLSTGSAKSPFAAS